MEQPLPKHGACCLSSINLSEFVKNPYTKDATFDLAAFDEAVSSGIKYLDNIVDLTMKRHPLKEQREVSYNYRNVGLGTFGLATTFMKLGIEYGTIQSIALVEIIYDNMFRMAVTTSSKLAAENGSFPKYTEKVWESTIIQKHFKPEEIKRFKSSGLRNCSLLSIAPTGSIATMLGESGGVEAEYAISYTRRTVGMTENKDKYYQVFCKGAREYMELHPNCDVEHLPKYFIASENIDPFDRIKLQAIMQKHIDTAISSTINLAESATEELMERLYLEGWKAGLKGLTIFRNNCKKVGILTTSDPKKSNDHLELSRGEIIECSDDLIGMKRKLCSGCGSLHVLAYFDPATKKMMEVYLSKGSTGGCQQFMIGLSRTISLLCRAGVDVYTIKDQLDSTGSCPSYAVRSATKHDTSKGSCCPMAIGNALVEMYEEFQEDKIEESPKKKRKKNKIKVSKLPEKIKPQSSDVCPECGSALQHVGGCINCTSCGWSKCN